MAGPKQRRLRLSPKAEQDLENIWLYSADNWSADQADAYLDSLENTLQLLSTSPELARERSEFDPPVRIYPVGRHLVIYREHGDSLDVLRVLGARQDWISVLRMLDQ